MEDYYQEIVYKVKFQYEKLVFKNRVMVEALQDIADGTPMPKDRALKTLMEVGDDKIQIHERGSGSIENAVENTGKSESGEL